MKRKKRKKKIFSLHVFVNIQYYETLTRFNTRTIYIEYDYNSKIFVTVLCCNFNSRYASSGGGGGGSGPLPFFVTTQIVPSNS